MRILGFGTYDAAKHPRVGIVLDGLRRTGDDIVIVNEPLRMSTAQRVEMLARPWLLYRLAAQLLRRWWALARGARRAARAGAFDAVVVGYLGHFDVLLARVLFPRGVIVLDMLIFGADTARDRGMTTGVTSGPKLRLLDLLDRLAIRCASVVMLDTDEHCLLLPGRSRHKGVVVPVGAAHEWFAARATVPPRNSADRLRVAFFGLYTPLQGAPVIGAALGELAARTDIEVTMIGTGQDLEATRAAAAANTSVHWLDWVESAQLPATVAAHDVCLGIFSDRPKALRVVPNKVYEGAAAGCAVVTSDTAPQRRALGEAALFVPPNDPHALAEALIALRDDPERLAGLRAAARARADERFTPADVVAPLRDRLRADQGLAAG